MAKLLTDEFIKQYEGRNPMGELGSFVYYRTYSRWIEEEGRRESWHETVRRAVEYNCSLSPTTTREEAESLYDAVFNMKGFLSGRTFWIGGTKAVNDHPLANFNCSAIVLDKFDKLYDLFYALVVGTGAGFRVMKEDIDKLPPIRHITLHNKPYKMRLKEDRQENTSLTFTNSNKTAIIHIGDSKEGWCDALRFYLNMTYKRNYRDLEEIYVEYDSVRPKGERLKRFGGTASGHEPLIELFDKFDKIIKNRVGKHGTGKLKDIDMLDFANIIASIVVVGGVRRSAEIGMFGQDQGDCIQAKNDLYTQDQDGNWIINQEILHRQLSNNTIIHWEKPTREFWKWQFEQMRYSGEPAFYNGEHALKRNEHFKLTNPCGEVLLDDQQTCNLVTNNVMAHVEDDGLNINDLYNTHKLLTRASYRMTNVDIELPDWSEKLHRDRLLGVSITGWQDMVNATGININSQSLILELMRDVARESADEMAEEMGLSKSTLVTTVKPEGTLSLLPTVSSGVHFSHSEYYIRRIRINSDDALAKVCMQLGYEVHPEVGSDWSNAKTYVIEFPVKSPSGKTKYDVSAIEQLEIYKMFMESYVDHNASITVSVRDNEWDDVEQWVYDNWDSCIGISFLSLDDSYFQLMPYEATTKEDYEKRVEEMKPITVELINRFEKGNDHELEESDCVGGACPIK